MKLKVHLLLQNALFADKIQSIRSGAQTPSDLPCILCRRITVDTDTAGRCSSFPLIRITLGAETLLSREGLVTQRRRLRHAGTRLGQEHPSHRQISLWLQALLLLAFWAAFLLLQVPILRYQSPIGMA